MALFGAHGPDAVHHGVLDEKQRLVVAAAKGRQPFQLADLVQRQLGHGGGGVQLQHRRFRPGMALGRPAVDGAAESGQSFFLQRQAGGGRVAAVAGQQAGAGFQRAVQVKAAGGAAAAPALAVGQRDHDGRAAKPLHQAAGHDAQHTGVPVFAPDHQHPVMGAGGFRLQPGQGGGQHLLLGVLAGGVDLGQAGGDAVGLLLVLAQKQL